MEGPSLAARYASDARPAKKAGAAREMIFDEEQITRVAEEFNGREYLEVGRGFVKAVVAQGCVRTFRYSNYTQN